MGRRRWLRVHRRLQDACSQSLARLGGPPPARGIVDKAQHALGHDPLSPEAHGLPTRAQRGSNVVMIVARDRQ